MANLYCPSCGKQHNVSNRYCMYCGQDLEKIIQRFKDKRLPIKYQTESRQRGPYQQDSEMSGTYYTDPLEDRGYRRRSERSNWDMLFSILFFWMCCGPDCD